MKKRTVKKKRRILLGVVFICLMTMITISCSLPGDDTPVQVLEDANNGVNRSVSSTSNYNVTDTSSAFEEYSHKGYGIFVHYGFGGSATDEYGCSITQYPDGSIPETVDEVADNFDVQGFVDDIVAMSPEYLIFTAWHCWQYPLYPSDVIDDWLGEPHSSQRDVLQELLDACEAEDLDVYWYIQPSEAHNFSPEQQAAVGYIDRSTYSETYNDFLNELIAELTNRYKAQVKGFWFDKGLSYGCTDTARIGETIRAILPDAVLIANTFANESADFGAVEVKVPSVTFSRDGYVIDNANEETWPAYERSISFVSDSAWFAEPGTIRYTSEMMYKYTVLQAGVNEEGGGVAWSMGPYPTTTVSWNEGILSGMTGLGSMIDEVGESIKSTVPSDSWPTAEGTTINDLDWGIATRSADGDFEYLHVLKSLSGTTLTINTPDDGRVYTSAVNLRTGNACSFSQTSSQVSITLNSSDSWDSVDSVIKLTTDGVIIVPPVEPGGNIAEGKTAEQSITAYSGVAGRAVDGNTDGLWASGSVTHTDAVSGSWWQVDLGEEYSIGDIIIWNRTDTQYMSRLSDYTIQILDSSETAIWDDDQTEYPNPFTTANAGGITGRYVKIIQNSANPLSLAEVQVYEELDVDPPVEPDENISDGKTTEQSTTAYEGEASRAVDGNTDGLWSSGSVTHTEATGSGSWWQVDLEQNYSIGDIIIWNRTDTKYMSRLTDYTILVLDAVGDVIWENYQTGYPDPSTTVNAGGIIGSYVKIIQNGDAALSLAEVQVFGN
ncbi:MAG: discoidin domain-containing protein [Spirochaetaceae bacterium]